MSMTISEAIEAVSKEYDREVHWADTHRDFHAMMAQTVVEEYEQIDRRLPLYVAEIAAAHGVPNGTVLPQYVYQMARMCFRFGMRTQRKLDHPELETSMFWGGDEVKA